MAIDTTSPRSRRALLTAAVGGVAAALAATIARVSPTEAADGGAVIIGNSNFGNTRTRIKNSTAGALALEGESSGNGTGVLGETNGGTGVRGIATSSVGVRGSATTGTGILGTTSGGVGEFGVRGEASTGNGIGVRGGNAVGVGVLGKSDTVNGVRGESQSGVGVFGRSTTGTAVRAQSTRVAVHARSFFGIGLHVERGRIKVDEVSGVATIARGRRSVTIDPGVPVNADTFVLLTPKTNIGTRALWFTTHPVPNKLVIRMSSTRGAPTRVAWLALEKA